MKVGAKECESKCWVKDERRTGPAGFVPRCPSLNPGKEEKTIDGKVRETSTGRKQEESQRRSVWGFER